MLLVKTYLDRSDIAGMGLFTDQFIPKGTVIWKFVPGFDVALSDKEYRKLLRVAKDWLQEYSYYDKWKRVHIICVDEDRFFNHAQNSFNIDNTDREFSIAKRDIRKGEELTCNYHEFDLHAQKKLSMPQDKARQHLKKYGALHAKTKPTKKNRRTK